MAQGALFIGWGNSVRGREQLSLQVFQEALQFFGRLQQSGQIESFEPVQLEPHGGDLAGFLLIKGDSARLGQLRMDEDFLRLTTRGQMVVEHFGVAAAFLGDELQRMFTDFGQQANDLLAQQSGGASRS
jgi:hypothetical protein